MPLSVKVFCGVIVLMATSVGRSIAMSAPILMQRESVLNRSKCKLHHPKNRSKGKKRKRSREQKNAQGRYFGSTHIDAAEPGAVVSEKHSAQNNDNNFLHGRLADYISLDVSDEEAGETIDPTSKQTTYDSDSSDLQLDDPDELIKPFRIINNNLTT
ncbi:hypothetical protein L1049_026935 [Liquidambar formosana]|uniref:Uncharacterized protein n=1 Tax=Liquidambar formosana TaxID=63359 RepID=A0AAP0NE94_LIQFO